LANDLSSSYTSRAQETDATVFIVWDMSQWQSRLLSGERCAVLRSATAAISA
jgi:hypothetical protein